MLQRIQTIFLLLITLLSALQIFLPFQTIITYEETHTLFLSPAHYNALTLPIIHLPLVICILISVLALITVFLYKNRTLQMRMCTILALMSLALTASLVSFSFIKLADSHETVISYNLSAFFPLMYVVLAFIAKRFIKRDDDLVKSADRIR